MPRKPKEIKAKPTQVKNPELDEYKVYTLTDIEPIIGVTHRTLLNYVKLKRMKCVKVGGKWKISGENLRKFINGETD